MKFLSEKSRPGKKYANRNPIYNYVVWNEELIESSNMSDSILGTFKNPGFKEHKIDRGSMDRDEQELFKPKWEKKLDWKLLEAKANLLNVKEKIGNYRKKILGFNKGGLVDADRDTISVNFIMGI